MKNKCISKRIGLFVMLVSLASLTLTGCRIPALSISPGAATTVNGTSADQSTDPTDERLIFSGKILSVDPSGQSFLAAVDEKDQNLLGDKASVGLYDDATVTRADTGATINLKDVPAGSAVTVTITGGIRESYPVQVSAVSVEVTLEK